MSNVKLDYEQTEEVTKQALLEMYGDCCYNNDDLSILPHLEAVLKYMHSRSSWILVDAALEKIRKEAGIEE